MMMILKKLADLVDRLDADGFTTQADAVDSILADATFVSAVQKLAGECSCGCEKCECEEHCRCKKDGCLE